MDELENSEWEFVYDDTETEVNDLAHSRIGSAPADGILDILRDTRYLLLLAASTTPTKAHDWSCQQEGTDIVPST